MLARENQVLSGERVVPMVADGLLPIVVRRRPDEHAGYVGARGRLARLRDGVAGARRRLSDACVDDPRETPRLFQETVRMSPADLRVMTSNQTIWTSELSVASGDLSVASGDLSVASGDLSVASGDLSVATEAAMKRRASWAFVPETPSVVRETIAEPTADLRVMTSDRAFVWLSRIVVLFERAVDWSERTVVWFSETVVWFIQAIVWSGRTFPWLVPGRFTEHERASRERVATSPRSAASSALAYLLG
jgi:hypothetical protein